MTHRSLLLFALGLLPAALLPACHGSANEPRQRNVLLVVVDTLRADRLGCYGYPRPLSPNVDSLAARGVRYDRNRSQSCWTIPSMISLMSGEYVANRVTALPADRPALAEVARDAGYVTAAFIGNRVLTEDQGFDRGFDHFSTAEEHQADALVRGFGAWFEASREERAGSRGFFAWIHPYDPHHPYVPHPQGFDGPRPDQEDLIPRWRAGVSRHKELLPSSSVSGFDAAVRTMQEQSNAYDDEVAAVDKALGALLALLEQEGVGEDTLVVFAADHGELLWEHPGYPQDMDVAVKTRGAAMGAQDLFMQGHRAWFHREVWNTPLILAGPGVPQGVVRDGLAANLDIYPTVLEFLGLPLPPGLDGGSLLGGGEPERDLVFAHGFGTSAVAEASGLKLIEHPAARFLLEQGAASPLELFDAQREPSETEDLAASRSADTRRLQEALRAWRQDRSDRGASGERSERTQRALRDLGYVDH